MNYITIINIIQYYKILYCTIALRFIDYFIIKIGIYIFIYLFLDKSVITKILWFIILYVF